MIASASDGVAKARCKELLTGRAPAKIEGRRSRVGRLSWDPRPKVVQVLSAHCAFRSVNLSKN